MHTYRRTHRSRRTARPRSKKLKAKAITRPHNPTWAILEAIGEYQATHDPRAK